MYAWTIDLCMDSYYLLRVYLISYYVWLSILVSLYQNDSRRDIGTNPLVLGDNSCLVVLYCSCEQRTGPEMNHARVSGIGSFCRSSAGAGSAMSRQKIRAYSTISQNTPITTSRGYLAFFSIVRNGS